MSECPSGYTYLRHNNDKDFMFRNLVTTWYADVDGFSTAKTKCDADTSCSGFIMVKDTNSDPGDMYTKKLMMRMWGEGAHSSDGKFFSHNPSGEYEWCVKDSDVSHHPFLTLQKN